MYHAGICSWEGCRDFAIRSSPFCKNNDFNENYTPIYYFEYTNKDYYFWGLGFTYLILVWKMLNKTNIMFPVPLNIFTGAIYLNRYNMLNIRLIVDMYWLQLHTYYSYIFTWDQPHKLRFSKLFFHSVVWFKKYIRHKHGIVISGRLNLFQHQVFV